MHLWIRLSTCIWLLCAPLAVAVQPNTALTLQQAVARVLESNPQLQAAGFDARAAAERIRQQDQSTPYEIGVDLENFAGSGTLRGTDSLETTLSLGRVLEFGGKAQQRGEVARLEAGLLRHEQDALRLDLLAETARRFLAVARVQAQRELAGQRVALLGDTVRIVEQRHRVGKGPAGELGRARIELARAELALEETDHLLTNGRRELAVMWGAFAADFPTVQAALFVLESEPPFAALDAAIDRNPAIVRLSTIERVQAARLALARSRARPDLDVRAGVRHLNGPDDVGLMLSLRMPLGSASRSRAYISEAEALAAREPLLAQDRRLALRATLSELHQELLHARDRFETYQDRIVPTAEQTLNDYRQGYAAGRYSLLELSAAQDTLLEARLALLDAAAEHHAARIEIDRLIGATPLNGDTP